MTFAVYSTSYGVRIVDTETLDEIAVETKDIRGLATSILAYVPMDFNTVVTRIDDSTLHHTFAKDCPPGCYGQLEACPYKKVYAEELAAVVNEKSEGEVMRPRVWVYSIHLDTTTPSAYLKEETARDQAEETLNEFIYYYKE
jgi:hypothetical protein